MPDHYQQAIRTTMKKVRLGASAHFRANASKRICDKIKTLNAYRGAKRIALYASINGEVDLSLLWKTAPLQGKWCFFPVLHEDSTLSFLPTTPQTPFAHNKFGIEEPQVSLEEAVPLNELDLVLLPVVAFDKRCTRLGMGGGSYDKTLAHVRKGLFIGVAYQFQCVNYLSRYEWDVPLDAVVTEKNIYWNKAKHF